MIVRWMFNVANEGGGWTPLCVHACIVVSMFRCVLLVCVRVCRDSLRVVRAVSSARLLPRTTTVRVAAAAGQRDELVERPFRGGQLR